MPDEPVQSLASPSLGEPGGPAAHATEPIAVALAQLTEGVIVADAAGRITFVNEAAARLHGVARLDVPLEGYSETYHLFTEDGAPYPPVELPLARAVLRGETVLGARWRIRRPDGTEIVAVGSARPLAADDGTRLGAVLTLRDDTPASLAAAVLRERDAYAARLEATFLQSPVSTVVYDPAGRPLAANPAFERLWGAGLADVPADYSVLTDPQLEAAGVLPAIRRAFAGEAVTLPALRYDVASTTGRGRTRWTQAHLYPVRDAAGRVEQVVLAHEDVTARREAEATLAQRNEQLEAQGVALELSNRRLQEQASTLQAQAAALRASETQLRTLADAIPTLAWTARADGYVDWYNARWYEYTGTTRQQMEGWGWQRVHDPAVLPAVLDEWSASIASGRPFEMTFPLRRADGAFRAFLTRVTPVRDADGRVVRWFGTNTDVEPERQARLAAEAAAARAQRLQALTAALASARTLDDVAAVVVAEGSSATGARTGMLALRTPGADEAVIVRQNGLAEVVSGPEPRFSLGIPGPAAQCLRTGEPIFIESREGPDGLGARFADVPDLWGRLGTHALATVPLSVGGEVVGAMSFTFDAPRPLPPADRDLFLALGRQAAQATERVRLLSAERLARAEAEAARARADEANRAKSQFLANMSHELRTPLNAIGGYVELLDMGLRGPLTDAQRADLQRVKRAQLHLLGLINDVLNLARIETGRVEYDVHEVDLAAAIADVAPMIEPQVGAKGLEFSMRAPAPGLLVWADPDKLRQVLLNVLSNAAKFTGTGGRVVLEVADRADGSAPADLVFVRVTDSGRGIRRDKLEAVFEPFVQLARDLTAGDAFSQQGTGLGLAISRDLARGMGGDLRARSEEGVGSTFTIALRRVVAASGQPVDRRGREERRADEDRRAGEDRRTGEAG